MQSSSLRRNVRDTIHNIFLRSRWLENISPYWDRCIWKRAIANVKVIPVHHCTKCLSHFDLPDQVWKFFPLINSTLALCLLGNAGNWNFAFLTEAIANPIGSFQKKVSPPYVYTYTYKYLERDYIAENIRVIILLLQS